MVRTRFSSTLTESFSGSATSPSFATRPLTRTRPSRIHSSAARREARPAPAMIFWMRTGGSSVLVFFVVVVFGVVVVVFVFVFEVLVFVFVVGVFCALQAGAPFLVEVGVGVGRGGGRGEARTRAGGTLGCRRERRVHVEVLAVSGDPGLHVDGGERRRRRRDLPRLERRRQVRVEVFRLRQLRELVQAEADQEVLRRPVVERCSDHGLLAGGRDELLLEERLQHGR